MSKSFLRAAILKPDCKLCMKNREACQYHKDWRPPEKVKVLNPRDFAHLLATSTSIQKKGCRWCSQPTKDGFDECTECWNTQRPKQAASGKQSQATEFRSVLGYSAASSGGPEKE